MKTAICTLESITSYSQARHYTTEVPEKPKESKADYEDRTWRNRVHVNSDGLIIIPPMAFKNCVESAAAFLGEKIPGKGHSTYSKHFRAGIFVVEPLVLQERGDQVKGEWLFVPSDGKRGSGKRVMKCFPIIHKWCGDVKFIILDSVITHSVFENTLREAGNFIGIGRFRPFNGGYYGRFKVTKVRWED